jgi:hypothetical protein
VAAAGTSRGGIHACATSASEVATFPMPVIPLTALYVDSAIMPKHLIDNA